MTDPFSQFMAGGELPAAGLTWLLDTFATPFLKAIGGKWQDNRERARWDDALQSYGQSILRHYGRLRVLGKNEDVPLGSVFTDVYILDQISARRRFDIRELMEKPVDRVDLPQHSSKRRNGMGLVNQGQSLYILGKPGAGKTTFLKNVAVRAIADQLGSPTQRRLPLFVPLHDWANSKHNELLPFLVEQLDVHHFPYAEDFLEYLLGEGTALLLFDGLDEVRQEQDQRANLARKLRNFTIKYDKCQYLITCRVAASEYVFPGLRDVEMADFTEEQVIDYAQKWFGVAKHKFENFADDLKKPENAGLAELCNVPLLLSLLCLYYDDAQAFPARRAELYEDALDALLRKWDSSRQIQRDEIYRGLSHKRKRQLFAHIATPAFEKGRFYFTTQQLTDVISRYLSNLSDTPPADEIDSEVILRSIGSQHGVLVERAHDIYSFSHLSFQEFFTAHYIVENEARGTVERLIQDHLIDQRWQEVFLLTASLLDNADDFVTKMSATTEGLVGDGWLAEALIWLESKTQILNEKWSISLRLAYLSLDRDVSYYLELGDIITQNTAKEIIRQHYLAVDRIITSPFPFEHDLTRQINDFSVHARAIRRFSEPLLARELNMAIGLRSSLHHIPNSEVSVDYALYHLWAIADILASVSELQIECSKFTFNFHEVIRYCQKLNITDVPVSLFRLNIPKCNTSQQEWISFARSLWIVLEEQRGFRPPQKLLSDEYNRLGKYLYANELLLRCLDLAYVTNRQEILDNLLRPPG